MGAPYRIVAGTTYLITRRCSQRAFRLRPEPLTNQILKYCLALAASRTGVKLHALCVLANHYHLIATDADGCLPQFLHLFHLMCARTLNASQGQWESLWSSEETNRVRLESDADVVEKVAYVVANPVAAGLVEVPAEYPGIIQWSPGDEPVKRPDRFFAEDGACPPAVTLRFVEPPTRGEASMDWTTRIAAAIQDEAVTARRKVLESGRAFLGPRGVLEASIHSQSRSREERRDIVPRIAAKDPELRRTMLEVEKAFQRAYTKARQAWVRGVRDVLFPFGTWWMRVFHRALVATEETPLLLDGASAG